MSTNEVTTFAATGAATKPQKTRKPWTNDLRTARIIRYAVGVTAAVAIAFGINWPLAFLTPVFVAVFLSLPLPAPSLKQGINSILYVFISFFLGLLFTLFLLPFPLVYVIMIGLTLFHIYYLANRRGPVLLVLFCLLAVLILPMLGMSQDAIPTIIATNFALSALLAVLLVWMAHGIFTDPPVRENSAAKRPGFQATYSNVAAITALKSTIAILPMAILFIAQNWSSQLLIMIFTAIFSLSPGLSQGTTAALKSLKSTLIGGIAALIYYYLIIAVPEFHFFVLLMFFTTLGFGAGLFSSNPNAQYLSSAVTTIIVLLGTSMGENANLADTFITRVLLISAAALYVVAVFSVLDRLFSRK